MKNQLLAFLMLTALVFGCKPRTQELTPQKTTINPDLIEKAKIYFENAQSQALTKTVEVSIGARDNKVNLWQYPAFRTFQPIWNKTEQVTLLNGNKVLIAPLHRNMNVDYNNLYYIRRLRIELNAQNQVIKTNIVELVTLKRTVASQKYQIIANVFEEMQTRTDAKIMIFDAGYTPLEQNSSIWKGEATNNNSNAKGSVGDAPAPCYYLTAIASCSDVQYLADIPTSCDPGDPAGTIYGVGNIINNCPGGGSGGGWTPPSDPNNPPGSGQTGGNGDIGQDEPLDPNYLPPNINDPDGAYKRYKEFVKTRFDYYKKLSNDTTVNEKVKNMAYVLYKEYRDASNEIKKIEKSKFQYNIVRNNSRDEGYTKYNPQTQKIDVVLGKIPQDGNIGLEAHEFKHVYQFEIGQLTFDKISGEAGKAYDRLDEVEAYQRQHFFMLELEAFIRNYKGEYITYTPNGYQVTQQDVIDIGSSMTPRAYYLMSNTTIYVDLLLSLGDNLSTDIFIKP